MELDQLIKALYLNMELQKQILSRLDVLLGQELKPKKNTAIPEDLIDDVDAVELLKVSRSTLYRYRKQKILNTTQNGKRHYYSLSEIKAKFNPKTDA